MTDKKVKVLIVDDSALMRALLKDMFESSDKLDVCGTACDPYEAREKIKQLNPDVLTLDIEMPKMNGITFLKNLMRLRPMPVVMISTLTQDGAPATLEALEVGAVDFIAKPKNEDALAASYHDICAKVWHASKANIKQYLPETDSRPVAQNNIQLGAGRSDFICAVGASTGGTEAIKHVISQLPENCPPIVVTQHIPANFSASFAKRVDACSKPSVHEAVHDQLIEPGNVYIAPGHSHLRVKRVGKQFLCKLDQSEPVNRHRPAVEVLFDSVREACTDNCMGVLLTGMGADGAEALLRLRQCGANTIAQNESSSVVWGMPGAAVQLDAAEKILDIEIIAAEITRCYTKK